MSIKAYWDEVDPQIMRIDYDGEWKLSDQEELAAYTRTLIGDENAHSDVIIHVHESAQFPRMISPKLVHGALQTIPTNPGTRVFVGAPVIMQTVMGMFNGLVGDKMGVEVVAADTIEEARQIIHHKRKEGQ